MIASICSEPKVLEVMRIVNIFISIIRIVVPILLIFVLMFKLISAITNNDKDSLAKVKKTVPSNIIAAVIIFIIPTLINLIVKITFPNNDYQNCLKIKSIADLQEAYENKMEELVSKAEETLEINDYNNAKLYLKNIKDEEKKAVYEERLAEVYEKIKEKQKIRIASINVEDSVVSVEVTGGLKKVAGYYFSSIDSTPELDGFDWIETDETSFTTVKYPGTYYLFVKDEDGYITESTEVVVPEDFDVTLMHKGKKVMPITFDTYLHRHGSSVDEFNRKLASYNLKYGLRTRESVVVGAMAFTGEVQSWGYYLPYSGSNGPIEKDSWGIYKYWGGNGKTFLACDPFVVWCYKNAGLNIYANRVKMRRHTPLIQVNKNGTTQEYKAYKSPYYRTDIRIYYFFVGVVGSTSEIGDNIIPVQKGLPGDVLQNGFWSGHEMLIVDKYDDDMDGVSDGYIVLQSRDIGLCYEKRPYNKDVIVYDMTKVFDNSAGFADLLNGWQSYYIPESDYPSYLR